MNEPASNRLSRDTVLRAALALLDEVGIDALSTRRLAERLGVQSPTLYWHFKSKAALLGAMAEAILAEQHPPVLPRPSQPWQDWFIANALGFRKGLLAYRDGARLHAGTRPTGAQFDEIEANLVALQQAGFTPEAGMGLMLAVSRFVVGWVLEEQAGPPDGALGEEAPDAARYPLSAQGWQALGAQAADALFEQQLRLFVAGAAATLPRKRARSA